jgi:chromosome segregation ATPase
MQNLRRRQRDVRVDTRTEHLKQESLPDEERQSPYPAVIALSVFLSVMVAVAGLFATTTWWVSKRRLAEREQSNAELSQQKTKLQQLIGKNETLFADMGKLENKYKTIVQEKEQGDAELSQHKTKLQELIDTNETLLAHMGNLECKYATIVQELEKMRNKCSKQLQDIQNANRMVSSWMPLKEANSVLREQIQSLEEASDTLKTEHRKLNQTTKRLQEHNELLLAEKNQAELDLVAYKASNQRLTGIEKELREQLNSGNAKAEAEKRSSQERFDKLRVFSRKLESEKNEMTKKLEDTAKELDSVAKYLTCVEKSEHKFAQQVKSLTDRLTKSEEEKKKLESDIAELEESLEHIRSKPTTPRVQQRIDRLETELLQAQKELQLAREQQEQELHRASRALEIESPPPPRDTVRLQVFALNSDDEPPPTDETDPVTFFYSTQMKLDALPKDRSDSAHSPQTAHKDKLAPEHKERKFRGQTSPA